MWLFEVKSWKPVLLAALAAMLCCVFSQSSQSQVELCIDPGHSDHFHVRIEDPDGTGN